MNNKQYNNVIDWTLKHVQAAKSEDSLEAARAIFKNMGVALPNGSMQEVFETIKTNDYMGWKSCTMEEAQQAADKGVAAIGISEDQIVVLAANDEDELVAQTAAVMTLSENNSSYAAFDLQYYSYTYETTCQDSCGSVGVGNNGLLANDTYYLNNKHYGKYLTYESANSVIGQSGLLEFLGVSIQWVLQNIGSGYVIYAVNDMTKYLGVPTSTSSGTVELVTVSGSAIPQRCLWSINCADGGGYIVKSVHNCRYLYTDGTTISTVSDVSSFGSIIFDTRVWRIVSTSKYGNTESHTYRELAASHFFPNVNIDVGEKYTPTVGTYPTNILWAASTDFDYTTSSTSISIDSYTKVITGQTRTPPVTVTATHKVTGYKKTFKVTVVSNFPNLLNYLCKLYDVAYAYENQNQAKAFETMFRYIRRLVYHSGMWPGVAGEVDRSFVEAVFHSDPLIEQYFMLSADYNGNDGYRIMVPDPATGANVDVLHMTATLNRLFYSGETTFYGVPTLGIMNNQVDDLSGWAGDFQSLIANYFNAGNAHATWKNVYNAFYPMIGSDSYSCSYSDIITDMDSCNLYTILSSSTITTGAKLKEVLENYYYGISGNVAAKRFTTWIGSMSEDELKTKISKYCNDHSEFFIKWPLLDSYSIYDSQQYAFTEAFTDYLLEQKALE